MQLDLFGPTYVVRFVGDGPHAAKPSTSVYSDGLPRYHFFDGVAHVETPCWPCPKCGCLHPFDFDWRRREIVRRDVCGLQTDRPAGGLD